jgi:hypothetical protein
MPDSKGLGRDRCQISTQPGGSTRSVHRKLHSASSAPGDPSHRIQPGRLRGVGRLRSVNAHSAGVAGPKPMKMGQLSGSHRAHPSHGPTPVLSLVLRGRVSASRQRRACPSLWPQGVASGARGARQADCFLAAMPFRATDRLGRLVVSRNPDTQGIQTPKESRGIQTPRNPDTQESRHPRNPDTQEFRHRNPDTQEFRGIQTRNSDTQEFRHP